MYIKIFKDGSYLSFDTLGLQPSSFETITAPTHIMLKHRLTDVPRTKNTKKIITNFLKKKNYKNEEEVNYGKRGLRVYTWNG